MAQSLKIVQFESGKSVNGENVNEGISTFDPSVFITLKIAAIAIAILGVLSLVFEIRIYSNFRYEIYLARLFPTLFSLVTLILLQTKFGKKNQTPLAHIFLLTVLVSLSFVVYKIPSLYLFNIIGASLFVLTLALFFNWGVRNQIIVGSYFAVLFGISVIASNLLDFSDVNSYLLIGTIFSLLIISVLASNLGKNLSYVGNNNLISPFRNEKLSRSNTADFPLDSVEQSIIPLFQIAFDGEIKISNYAFREILNLTDNQNLSELNFFDDCLKNENVKKHILKKLESKGKLENYRLKILGKDKKSEIFIMDCQTKIVDNNNYFEGSVRNITEQHLKEKILDKELETLKKINRKSAEIVPSISSLPSPRLNVISSMGHELRTPMNSVLGFLTLIENGLFQNEDELKEFSRSAKLSAESLLRILNDLVEISKIEDGLVEIVNSKFNIREAIENITSDLTPNLLQKELNLTCDISENVPENILADSSKYSQILSNLLSNAIHVTESGSIKIIIDQKKQNNGKRLLVTTIEDSGNGIPDDHLEEILDDKYNLQNEESSITTNILHLRICKELIKLLDGDISATSELGKGTRFTFTISLDSNDAGNEKIFSNGFNNINSGYKPKLLLVEDNPISRKVEQKLLQKAGYDVDCVDNGLDAIESIKKGNYNLVLMDIGLKDMNGLEATKKIRELTSGVNNIPIIAVTAHSSMKDREKCLLAGMNDYISKPININFLKMTIDQWLSTEKEN